MKSIFRLAVLSGALVMAGCSTITPMQMPEGSPSTAAKAREAVAISDGWNSPAVLTEGTASIVLMTPFDLPEHIKARKLQMTLEPGATVNDVVAILGEMGVPIIISDQEAAKNRFICRVLTETWARSCVPLPVQQMCGSPGRTVLSWPPPMNE